MSPRRRKAEDADAFAALVRVMQRRGTTALGLQEIAAEAASRQLRWCSGSVVLVKLDRSRTSTGEPTFSSTF